MLHKAKIFILFFSLFLSTSNIFGSEKDGSRESFVRRNRTPILIGLGVTTVLAVAVVLMVQNHWLSFSSSDLPPPADPIKPKRPPKASDAGIVLDSADTNSVASQVSPFVDESKRTTTPSKPSAANPANTQQEKETPPPSDADSQQQAPPTPPLTETVRKDVVEDALPKGNDKVEKVPPSPPPPTPLKLTTEEILGLNDSKFAETIDTQFLQALTSEQRKSLSTEKIWFARKHLVGLDDEQFFELVRPDNLDGFGFDGYGVVEYLTSARLAKLLENGELEKFIEKMSLDTAMGLITKNLGYESADQKIFKVLAPKVIGNLVIDDGAKPKIREVLTPQRIKAMSVVDDWKGIELASNQLVNLFKSKKHADAFNTETFNLLVTPKIGNLSLQTWGGTFPGSDFNIVVTPERMKGIEDLSAIIGSGKFNTVQKLVRSPEYLDAFTPAALQTILSNHLVAFEESNNDFLLVVGKLGVENLLDGHLAEMSLAQLYYLHAKFVDQRTALVQRAQGLLATVKEAELRKMPPPPKKKSTKKDVPEPLITEPKTVLQDFVDSFPPTN